MNLIRLQQYMISEERAEEYLQGQGILQLYNHCPYYENTRKGRFRRGKDKCYQCRKKWGPKRGIPEGLRVPRVRVLIPIKPFKVDTSVRKAAHQIDHSCTPSTISSACWGNQ